MAEQGCNFKGSFSWQGVPELRGHRSQVELLLERGNILQVLEEDADSTLDTELSLLHSDCLDLGPQGIGVISIPCAVQHGITGQKAHWHCRLNNLDSLPTVCKCFLDYFSLMWQEPDDLLLQI